MKRKEVSTLACVLWGALIVNGAFGEMQGEHACNPGTACGMEPGRGSFREKGPPEAAIGHIINNPEMAQEVGLTDAQVKILREAEYETRKRQITLNADQEMAGIEQARLMTEKTVDEAAVMAAIEKKYDIMKEAAKLKVKQALLIKRTLTPEQFDKIKEVAQKRMEQRRKKLGAHEPGEEGRHGPGKQRFHRPRSDSDPDAPGFDPDAEGERPAPPDETP